MPVRTVNAEPEVVVEYTDPVEGFKGWLVIDCLTHRLCAGGLRVQKGLSLDCVVNLAHNMTLKMRIAGIRADGAKSGIDYDPMSAGKDEALERFFRAIVPYMLDRYSVGPDLNTTMPELNAIASRFGLPSIKIAVARAQGLTDEEFARRTSILSQPAGFTTLASLRSGAGLAYACLGTLDFLNIPCSSATVTIQGFGGLAGGAAWCLNQAGVKIVAVSDRQKMLSAPDGHILDIEPLLRRAEHGLIPILDSHGIVGENTRIHEVECDVFIPAAMEKTVTEDEARTLKARAVVCGANLAVTPEAEKILHQRGILLVPDMVAGCGGSLSMAGLFGPAVTPSVDDVLAFVENRMRDMVHRVLSRSQKGGVSTREAAMQLCDEAPLMPGVKPYGPVDSQHNLPG